MKFSEKRLNRVIKESIRDYLNEKVVDTFTPYSEEQAAINKAAIGHVGNPSYDNASKADTAARSANYHSYSNWVANYKPKGISWQQYQKMSI